MKQKIIIAGGSGFLGQGLISRINLKKTEVVVLTREQSQVRDGVSYVHWDARTLGPWVRELEGSTAIVNLVGRSVNCRYTQKNKKDIIESRVNATSIIGLAIRSTILPPKVWINAGSAAIFGYSAGEIKDESSQPGEGFSPEVCKQWENAFHAEHTPQTRKVIFRIGVVLQAGTGLLQPFRNMVRAGLGGRIGSGEQYITWIHEEDFSNMIQWAIQDTSVKGVVHSVSPNPVKNKEFMKALRKASGIPVGLPNPALFVKIGALLIGTEAELVLQGRRVVSQIVENKGFRFKYPAIDHAMLQLASG